MIDLNKEAEYYAHNYFVMQDNHYNGLKEGYVAGANSKYVEQKILEAQIAILQLLQYTSECDTLIDSLKDELAQLT